MDARRLKLAEAALAYPVMAQLRTRLTREEFVRRVTLQQAMGYELVACFEQGAALGVMGMRAVHTLARGPHLHIDDLVVDAGHRRRGAGRALLAFALADAHSRGLGLIFLDAVPDAVGFYAGFGFQPHTSTLMRLTVA